VAVQVLNGDCREVLRTLPDESVHTCVTSPPYFGLRDYGHGGQIGLEPTPDAFVAELVGVFREVRRVLRDDGTLWLNLGDSYAGSWGAQGHGQMADRSVVQARSIGAHPQKLTQTGSIRAAGVKPKDLYGIPWRVAFALQMDGWYLRQDIIWHKPNPMPESVRDRCTKAHEYLFLLAKSERYYFDVEAISEPITVSSVERLSQPTLEQQAGSDRVPGKTNGRMKAVSKRPGLSRAEGGPRVTGNIVGRSDAGRACNDPDQITRNKRSVWTVTTKPFSGAHFATFPPDLIEPCILAGAPAGGTVLDPFGGAGTTGLVADRHNRNAVLIELNPTYADMARERIRGDAPLFSEVA
jgi:DNA modification methylase